MKLVTLAADNYTEVTFVVQPNDRFVKLTSPSYCLGPTTLRSYIC